MAKHPRTSSVSLETEQNKIGNIRIVEEVDTENMKFRVCTVAPMYGSVFIYSISVTLNSILKNRESYEQMNSKEVI